MESNDIIFCFGGKPWLYPDVVIATTKIEIPRTFECSMSVCCNIIYSEGVTLKYYAIRAFDRVNFKERETSASSAVFFRWKLSGRVLPTDCSKKTPEIQTSKCCSIGSLG